MNAVDPSHTAARHPTIQALPDQLISQIAAGEVVEGSAAADEIISLASNLSALIKE